MGDDTGYPSSIYSGGSEDDFNALRKKLVEAEKNVARWRTAFDVQHARNLQLRNTLEKLPAMLKGAEGEFKCREIIAEAISY